MACLFVVDEASQQVETFAFELQEDRIVEIGGENEGWSRSAVDTRGASRLVQYRLIQEWLADTEAYEDAVQRAQEHIEANLDQVIPSRVSELIGVERKDHGIEFAFRAKNTREMFRIRDERRNGAERHLYQQIRRLVCGSDERAALLAFQENSVPYTYRLEQSNGDPMTLYAAFPNSPC